MGFSEDRKELDAILDDTNTPVWTLSDEELKQFKARLQSESYGGSQKDYETMLAIIHRLECAEQVIVDIVYPEKGYLDGPPWRREHFNAWLKSKSEPKDKGEGR